MWYYWILGGIAEREKGKRAKKWEFGNGKKGRFQRRDGWNEFFIIEFTWMKLWNFLFCAKRCNPFHKIITWCLEHTDKKSVTCFWNCKSLSFGKNERCSKSRCDIPIDRYFVLFSHPPPCMPHSTMNLTWKIQQRWKGEIHFFGPISTAVSTSWNLRWLQHSREKKKNRKIN